MTAIAGLIRLDGGRVDPTIVQRMQSMLEMYGQDAQNHVIKPGFGLVRTLLRTTPEDYLDRQPLHHRESGIWFLWDGRLDNRDELGAALKFDQVTMSQMSDGELAMHCFLAWDRDAPAKFLGDFAFACWRPHDRRLLLARDQLTHRPMFWAMTREYFAFASMPKALFAVPGISRALDEERLRDFMMWLPVTESQSQFRDIRRLKRAGLLILDGNQVKQEQYHRFDPDHRLQLGSDNEYVEAFIEHMERAVSAQLRSIGPVGSHLSAGLDSSTVTSLAARLLATKDDSPVYAYTAVPREGYDGPVPAGNFADEGPGAASVARMYPNIRHRLVRTTDISHLEPLDRDIEIADQPSYNVDNMVWVNKIREMAGKEGVRALLSGNGGNMTISYAGWEYFFGLLGRGRWLRWLHELHSLRRNYGLNRHKLFRVIRFSVAPYFPAWLWVPLERMRGRHHDVSDYSAIHPDFRSRLGSDKVARERGFDQYMRGYRDSRTARILFFDRLVDFGENFTSANAFNVELRMPTADRRLIEFCLSLPDHLFFRNGQPKWIFHKAMDDHLPRAIIENRKQGLQAADWHETMERSLPALRRELDRLEQHPTVGRYVDLAEMRSLLENWPENCWHNERIFMHYRIKLLRGFSAGRFVFYAEDDNS